MIFFFENEEDRLNALWGGAPLNSMSMSASCRARRPPRRLRSRGRASGRLDKSSRLKEAIASPLTANTAKNIPQTVWPIVTFSVKLCKVIHSAFFFEFFTFHYVFNAIIQVLFIPFMNFSTLLILGGRE